jgi:hypothetical protein
MQRWFPMANRNRKLVARHLAWLLDATLITGFSGAAWANDPPAGLRATPGEWDEMPPAETHPCPRLKLSINRFAVNNLDSSAVPLTGAHLDVYPLSETWMRGGFQLQGGTGHASAVGSSISLTYGLLGLTAGVQYPGRVTPFLEGQVSGGVLSGRQEGSITVAGTTVTGASGTTWLYGRGLDAGAEFYVSGRVYISAAVGWMRATWGAPDFNARVQNPAADLRLVDMTSDSLMWKLGLGL